MSASLIVGPHPPTTASWYCSHQHKHGRHGPSASSTKSCCSLGTLNIATTVGNLYLSHPGLRKMYAGATTIFPKTTLPKLQQPCPLGAHNAIRGSKVVRDRAKIPLSLSVSAPSVSPCLASPPSDALAQPRRSVTLPKWCRTPARKKNVGHPEE